MALSALSGTQQGTAVTPKPYNGGVLSITPGINSLSVNIAASAYATNPNNQNGTYNIYSAPVNNGTVGTLTLLTTVPAVSIPVSSGYGYAALTYVDNTVPGGTTRAYAAALDNNA